MVKTAELLESIRGRLLTESFIRIPATVEEYESVSYERDLKIEYHNDEIIASMGKVTPVHSILVSRLIKILSNYYDNLENDFFWLLESGACVHIPTLKTYYQPDMTVINGEIKIKEGTTTEILNPYIVCEVLSKATQDFDMSEKLVNYKTIESIKQIIFVAQDRPWISTYTRTNEPNVWINTDYDSLENTAIIDNLTISLKDIYKKNILKF
ncbi:MAG: Uma2 family endonuclease [Arcicella sp.]|jgi:Uma2 family endonuclease|nr:Uma2 family endonuclease [Arcicella sp.]